MKKVFQVKPQNYGFSSKIEGFVIKTITWKDFPAKPPENTWFLAYTYWNTNWTSTIKNGKGTVLATVSIGPKAWTRAEDDFELLQHETGHYWIACLCALEFQKRVNFTQKKPDDLTFSEWCQTIFKKTSSQYVQQQKRYDKETYHYLNRQDQERWKNEMVAKFNKYHQFFQQKRKEQQKNLVQIDKNPLKEIIRTNVSNRGMKSLPATKNINNSYFQRPINNLMRNQPNSNRPTKQFSVRKANFITNPKHTNQDFKMFEKAKNTILGNIKILDGLK